MKTLPDQLPDDPALLKELIVKLTHQVNDNERLINDQARRQVAEQNKHQREIDRLQTKLNWFEEQLKLATFRQFGPSSEKQPAQDDLFNEAEAHIEEICPTVDETQGDAASEGQPKPRKPKRQPLPKNLPRERVEHDLPDDQKVCACCGGQLHQIGEEVSEQLDIIPAQIRVKEHVRLKYGCRGCEDGVTTAKAPKQPIPGSLASPGTLAYVVTAKYCDAMPLYR
ncbi:MAG: transposase [Pontibacterium sp.]